MTKSVRDEAEIISHDTEKRNINKSCKHILRVYKIGQRFSAKIHIPKAKRKYLEEDIREIMFKRHKNKRAILPAVWEVLYFLVPLSKRTLTIFGLI